MTRISLLFGAAVLMAAATTARGDISDAANACIDELRERHGNVGGEILSDEFSEAATLVMLRDANGNEYKCLVWSGPEIAEFTQVGGASAAPAPRQDEVVVRFSPGTTGATYSDSLGSGDAVRYVLGARNEQFLTVDLRGNSDFLNYIIYVPGGDILFESSQGGYKYEGQLYKSGDHTVEVFYNGDPGTVGDYDMVFQIN